MAWAMFISPWKWSLILPLHDVDIHWTELAAAEANLGSCKPDSKNCKIGSEKNKSEIGDEIRPNVSLIKPDSKKHKPEIEVEIRPNVSLIKPDGKNCKIGSVKNKPEIEAEIRPNIFEKVFKKCSIDEDFYRIATHTMSNMAKVL